MLMLVAMEGGVMVVRLFVPPPDPPGGLHVQHLFLRHKLPRDIRDTEARVTICDTDEIVAMYIHESCHPPLVRVRVRLGNMSVC